MTHTPGPWRVGDNGATIFGPKKNPRTIATLTKTPMILNETKANARLIAAAPEMLEELQFLVNNCVEMSTREYANGIEYEVEVIKAYDCTIKSIRELIIKVIGAK